MKRLLALLVLMGLSAAARGQTMPGCWPTVQFGAGGSCYMLPIAANCGAVPSTVSTRFDTYAVWVCTTPGGYVTWTNLFVLANVAPYVLQFRAGTWTTSQAAADCATTCVAPTPDEYAFEQQIAAPARPVAVVAFNGASVTRNVYTTNADGTLNPTPVPGVQVAVAAHCDETRRIPTAPNYYLVAGGANTLGGFIPANSYTVCVVAFPLAAN